MAASTLEFNNSTTKTMSRELISNAFSTYVIDKTIAIGVSRAKRVSSYLNADSSLNAYTSPHHEFFAAYHALAIPRLPL